MPARPSPTIRRRRLALELRHLREASGLTIERVAEALECSDSKVSRIETAHVTATPRDVRDMLELYGVAGAQRDMLVQMAREARQKGWWHKYRDYQADQASHVGLEVATDSIRMYAPLLIPGLLQIAAYARGVIRALVPEAPPEEIEHRLELRMARQPLLTEDNPPSLWAILDEAALRRLVGGAGVMREQLLHLVEQVQLPNVTLQVIPYTAGQHAGMDGAFDILSFEEPGDPDVVHLENATGQLYLERPDEVRRYSLIFDHLRAVALAPDDSTAFLTELAKEL
ncbi:MAG TPA: helix-turn-helix transcriptional regulator [Actinomycetota bacterium]|nr:helix-turn-helix transcriptional regulator [Actinomycetota bacterium]